MTRHGVSRSGRSRSLEVKNVETAEERSVSEMGTDWKVDGSLMIDTLLLSNVLRRQTLKEILRILLVLVHELLDVEPIPNALMLQD